MKTHRIWRGLKIFFFVALGATVFTFAVLWLWNWLMPALFGLPRVSFWQALGLLVLGRVLFGGFLVRPHVPGDWRLRLIQRWEQMTPEEREKLRAGLGGVRGRPEPPAAEPKG